MNFGLCCLVQSCTYTPITKNILNIRDSSQCRLQRISYVNEYGPELHYVEGSANVVADTFSQLLQKDTPVSPTVGKKRPAEHSINEDDVNETPLDNYFSWVDDREMFECLKCLPDDECYLNLPDNMVDTNPLDMENIKEQQDADDALLQHATKYADQYTHKRIGTIDDNLCYIKPGDPPNNWKITLPKSLLQPTIKWFHQVTGHPGSKRLFMQISSWYYHRDI
jgi:hypothetical protein